MIAARNAPRVSTRVSSTSSSRARNATPDSQRRTAVFARTPIPSISTSTRLPGVIGPTPAGVPVSRTSPGSSVIADDTNATSAGTSWIICDVRPSCTVSPSSRVVTLRSEASIPVASHGPSGQNES